MHLAAMAYNLKKYLKFTQKLVKTRSKALVVTKHMIIGIQNQIGRFLSELNFSK